jgi:hypothetical protein
MRDTGWSWKAGDAQPNLRYEPGSWGDLFKSAWAVEVALALAGPAPTLLDPFAGAPEYPFVAASEGRLEGLPAAELLRRVEPYRVRGRFPSTARLVLDCWEGGRAWVYDKDPLRLAAWRKQEQVEALTLADGAEALTSPPARDPTLVIVDPYDFFERFEQLLPQALGCAPRSATLLYLFNKSPRAVKARRRYGDLRRKLARVLESDERGLLVGRIPSDAVLPRAYHELLLIAPVPLLERVRDPLAVLARDLATHLATRGAFEVELPDPPARE